MRLRLILPLFFMGISCAGLKNAKTSVSKLDGTWWPVLQEMGGRMLPKGSFETQKLIIIDSNYTFSAESIDKGIIRYSDDKMDIYGRIGVNTGKHFTALYKYENDQLTICYNLAGNMYPEGFETKNKPLFFLSVYKKELKK